MKPSGTVIYLTKHLGMADPELFTCEVVLILYPLRFTRQKCLWIPRRVSFGAIRTCVYFSLAHG